MAASPYPLPPGFTEVREGRALLIAQEKLLPALREALGPLRTVWQRLGQHRFTARGRAGVVALPLQPGGPVIVRRYLRGGLMAHLLHDLYPGPERAVTELIVTEAARRGGLHTPRVAAVLATRAWGPFWRLAMMTEEIADSEDLVHYCCKLNEYPSEAAALEKRGVIREAALQIRAMHDLGVTHADLHLKNLLLRRRAAGPAQVYIIDFDRAALGPPLTSEQRLTNLKRLARSVRKIRVARAVVTPWDGIRFLRAYLAGSPQARPLLRRWARAMARAGSAHEVWWTATGARRAAHGDRIAAPR